MEPVSDDKDWDELTPAERKAASLLGYTRKTWDCEDNTEDRDDSSSSSESSDGESWKNLSKEAQSAAKTLGYTQAIWDNDGSPPTEEKDWDELSPTEQVAAKTLGYSEKKWNADDDDESDLSSDTPKPRKQTGNGNVLEQAFGSIRNACTFDSNSTC